nr:uncharacterized protein LOC129469662 [Symphalangus syndactylus]
MMSNTECFSEKLLLPDAIETLDNLRKETMSVSDLWNTLSSLNSNLKKDEFLAALKLVTVDEGDKVQFEEFAKVVRNMRDAARLEELQEVVLAADLLEGDMIAGKNLEDFLRNIGIKSPKEEVEKILQSDFVSEDNMVNIKDYMRALRDTQKFSNYIALNETINTLDSMKENCQFDKDKNPDVLENTDRLSFTDDILQEVMDDSFVEDFGKEASNVKLPKVNEIKEAANILSHVDNGKIGIPDLEHALKCLNVNLTEEDFNEALNCCNVSDNMEVDLKDFLMKMKESPHFQKSKDNIELDLKDCLMKMKESPHFQKSKESGRVTIQEFMTKLSDVLTIPKAAEDKFYNNNIHKNDVTAISGLQKNLNAMGIYLTDDKIQNTLDNTNPNDEVVHFKDFIRELANTDEFTECQKIEDAWNIINSVCDGKVETEDLLSTLKSLEKPLNEEEFKILSNCATDERKVILKDVVDVFTNSPKPSTPFNNLFKEIRTLDSIRNDTMPVNELSSKLLSARIPVSSKMFQEILRQASVDENSNVSLKKILENLNTSKPTSIFEADGTITQLKLMDTIKTLKGDKVNAKKPNNIQEKLGVELTNKESWNLREHLPVDGKRRKMRKFKDLFLTPYLIPLGNELDQEGKVDIDNLDTILEKMEMNFSDKEFEELSHNWPVLQIQLTHVKGTQSKTDGKVEHIKLVHAAIPVTGKKIDPSDFQNIPGSMSVKLTDKESPPSYSGYGWDVERKASQYKGKLECLPGGRRGQPDLVLLSGFLILSLAMSHISWDSMDPVDLSCRILLLEKFTICFPSKVKIL